MSTPAGRTAGCSGAPPLPTRHPAENPGLQGCPMPSTHTAAREASERPRSSCHLYLGGVFVLRRSHKPLEWLLGPPSSFLCSLVSPIALALLWALGTGSFEFHRFCPGCSFCPEHTPFARRLSPELGWILLLPDRAPIWLCPNYLRTISLTHSPLHGGWYTPALHPIRAGAVYTPGVCTRPVFTE